MSSLILLSVPIFVFLGCILDATGMTSQVNQYLSEKSNSLDAEALMAWSRQRMSAYKAPRSVKFLPALPRSGTGKVAWRELQEAEAQAWLEAKRAAEAAGEA